MPGIAGFVGKGLNAERRDVLHAMIKCLVHEKFHSSGTHVSEQLGLYCGWVVHEHSFSDCLPAWNETRDVCLIFAGEHYGDQSDIDELAKRGHACGTNNASYLVHLYEELGLEFINRLNGFFSGVVFDLRHGTAAIFNDRYGLGRIYYHRTPDGLYFGSEAKSLLKVLPELRTLDATSIAQRLSLECTLGNRTLFSGLSLMPSGSVWTVSRSGEVSERRYFDGNDLERQRELNPVDYYQQLKETFARILPRYFGGPQRVGVSLTGGLDTRMIMAWQECPPFKLPCYTFGGMYRDCTDVTVARRVASACQQHHDTIGITRGFFAEFPALAKKAVYYTDGTFDVSGAVGIYNHRLAREIAPVRITGNYGDQAMRSVRAFNPTALCEDLFDPELVRLMTSSAAGEDDVSQDSGLTFFVSKQMPWYYYPRFALESSQLTVRSPYLDNDLVSLIGQAPQDALSSKEVTFRLIAEGSEALSRIPTDRGLVYPPIPIVTKFRNLYEDFTFKAEYAYDHGMPQWLSRIDHALAPLRLERLFLGRHKYYHFRIWYRRELASYVKDILLDRRTLSRSYLRGPVLERMVMDHLEGRRNYTNEIHKILTFELIQRHLIEQR